MNTLKSAHMLLLQSGKDDPGMCAQREAGDERPGV
jgi:hypothetical protein